DGASFGTISAPSASAVAATVVKSISDSINAILGAGTALAVGTQITLEAPTAGTALPNITLNETDASGSTLAVSYATTRDNVVKFADSVSVATTGSVSAASFSGSEQIWLKGTSSNKVAVTGLGTQTLGLSGTTGLDSSAAFTGTTANINTTGASGDLALTGTKVTTVAVTGTGTAASLDLTHATATALTVNTTGAATIDATGLTKLTTVTASGAGAANVKVAASVTAVETGAGADRVNLKTATLKDNLGTVTDETVTATMATGAGADTVNVATTGTGKTSVLTGEGGDSIYVAAISATSTGYTVDAGAGNDTVHLLATANGTTAISGGEGTDTLIRAGKSFTAVDYVLDAATLSGFEKVAFTSAVGALDASKMSIGDLAGISFHDGANVITEVGAIPLQITGRAVVKVSTDAVVPASAAIDASQLTASALGYDEGTSAIATEFGGNLIVSADGAAENAVAAVLNGNNANVLVYAGVPSATDTAPATKVTLTGDLKTTTVSLASLQILGASGATLGAAGLSPQQLAQVNVTVANTATTTGLNALESITITGAGTATVVAGTGDEKTGLANGSDQITALTTIDLSGMTALASRNYLGLEVTATGASSYASTTYGYKNLSTSSVTLNGNVVETVTLGGAKDTVVTSSVIADMDTIIGFELAATATDADVVDTAKSDVIDIATVGGAANTYVAMDDTFANLNSGLIAAAAETGAYQVFVAGGDTYIY
ncbi:hypothetical protein N9O60_02430, partial [Gammaproteobacteria bacterium]|nr:hypothetical protein [Gammaproteobacteria bacterium]